MADCIELGNNQTILFTGDSITDAGRRNVGTSPLGEGYVSVVAKVLTAKYPQLNLKMINTGISGDTARSLKFRWNKDCLLHRPDILSLMIGINDLWYCHAEPELHIKGVPADEYEDSCRYMLEVEVDTVALVKDLDKPADVDAEDPSHRHVFGGDNVNFDATVPQRCGRFQSYETSPEHHGRGCCLGSGDDGFGVGECPQHVHMREVGSWERELDRVGSRRQ